MPRRRKPQRTVPHKSLADWLAFLEQLHPKSIDLGLDRCREVASRLELLKPQATTITVAGTNGKGSTVAVMEQCLRHLGETCGAFTSPHLLDFNERIRINGLPVGDDEIVAAFEAIDEARADISLSYFEFGALAALLIFDRNHVDHQLLEVGLGGRLDAVNVIDADLAIITSIGLDHQDWLGPDRETIAIEKCGVARRDRICVVAEYVPPDTLLRELARIGAKAITIGTDFSFVNGQLRLPERAEPLQIIAPDCLVASNVAAGLTALSQLGISVASADMNAALSELSVAGRRQVIKSGQCSYILDVAHNTEAIDQLIDFLEQTPCEGRRIAIFAALSDKPIDAMITRLVGLIDEWYLPDGVGEERGSDPALMATEQLSQCSIHPDFDTAWNDVQVSVSAGDQIVVFGSFFTVSEALRRLDVKPAGLTK
ncbi:MAG: bifunctional folylpolyglutamate synthase/dihydrofolate synthase [Luminiphilus sp.]|nr:bifunctional folylpolyglutamate synthase/dihydrofolate synthase [Luminiphilus sp.]